MRVDHASEYAERTLLYALRAGLPPRVVQAAAPERVEMVPHPPHPRPLFVGSTGAGSSEPQKTHIMSLALPEPFFPVASTPLDSDRRRAASLDSPRIHACDRDLLFRRFRFFAASSLEPPESELSTTMGLFCTTAAVGVSHKCNVREAHVRVKRDGESIVTHSPFGFRGFDLKVKKSRASCASSSIVLAL